MNYILLTLIFLFGSAVGSFVLVVASRYNTKLPFLKGRSVCFSCGTKLSKFDLIPIFSFLFLKGRCRHCGVKIPKETFIAEIIMGLLAILATVKSGIFNVLATYGSNFLSLNNLYLPNLSDKAGLIIQNSWLLATGYWLLTLAIFATILLISLYDLKHFIIPDSFLIWLLIFSFIYTLMLATSYSILFYNFSFSFILTFPFLLLFLLSKGTWLGFGDVKYIAVLAFWLGLAQGLSAIILAFWIGAVFSLLAMALKKFLPHINLPWLNNNLTIKSEIPFGPFLSLGVILSFYFGLDIFHLNFLFSL